MSQFVEKRVGEVLGRAPAAEKSAPAQARKDEEAKTGPERIFTF